MRTALAIGMAVVSLMGCSKKPTADDVCKKIEAAGVGTNCRTSQPNGLSSAAAEKVDFDLPSVAGKTGSVLRFDSDEKYTSTENAFTAAAVLAGPHRYGSKKALIFVQANSGLSADNGAKLKSIVDGL